MRSCRHLAFNDKGGGKVTVTVASPGGRDGYLCKEPFITDQERYGKLCKVAAVLRLALFFAIVLCVLGHSDPSRANGLSFCNHTSQSVDVAVGYWQPAAGIPLAFVENQGWISAGWWPMEPGDCTTPLQGNLNNRFYYFYAVGNGLEWNGTSDHSFCVTDAPFTFRGTPVGGCQDKTFAEMDIGFNTHSMQMNLEEYQPDPLTAAVQCQTARSDVDSFAKCWIVNMSSVKQREILQCLETESTPASFAICASRNQLTQRQYAIADCADKYLTSQNAPVLVGCLTQQSLTSDQVRIAQCAVANRGDVSASGECVLTGALTPELRKIYSCVSQNFHDFLKAGLCAAAVELPPEQVHIANCVLSNSGSYLQIGVCAVGPHLTTEQQAFVSCAFESGGVPLAYAACVGGELTSNELSKCLTIGIGGAGCFGPTNTLVKSIANAWHDVTYGLGSGNEIVKAREYLLRGDRGTIANIIRDPFKCMTFSKKC